MERNINIKIDIDDRAPTSYNDLIKIGDSINLTIDLLSKGESVDLKDSSVELFLKKEDGTKVEQEVIIGDSKVSCTPLNIQSTTVVGQVCGELVVESSGNQVTSSTFIFNVEGSTSSEILEESKDDIATIKSLKNTIVNVNSVVEKYKTNIEAIAGTSESIEALAQIKIYAESAVTEIETVVNTGNTLKTSLESENTRAENNIQELNNLGSESIKTHINNTDIHVAASDKTKWDSYEQLISDNTSHLDENTQYLTQLSNPNLLINGGVDVWQRGENFNKDSMYTADRWRQFSSNVDFTLTKSNEVPPNVAIKNSMCIEVENCSDNSTFILRSYQENLPVNVLFTLSYWIKGVAGAKIASTISDFPASENSLSDGSLVLNGQWQKVVVTFNCKDTGDANLLIFVDFMEIYLQICW